MFSDADEFITKVKKIEAVIAGLAQKKIEVLEKTWGKVRGGRAGVRRRPEGALEV